MTTIAARLFLSEIDTHHEKPLVGAKLRSYVLAQALFFDRLLVGDSQINNNARLRALLWNGESSATPGAPADLWILAKEGILVPTVRAGSGSLADLRHEHDSRGIADVPPEAYVHFLEEKLDGQRETYDLATVSSLFKQRTLAAFQSREVVGRGRISRDVRTRVYEFISSQNPLLFKSFRDWLAVQVSRNKIPPRTAARIDRIVAGTYRHNVAIALRTNLDVPPPLDRSLAPVDITLGDPHLVRRLKEQRASSASYPLRPTAVLSREFLSWMPASAIPLLMKLESRKKVVHAMEAFRAGAAPDLPRFVKDLQWYLNEVDMVVTSAFTLKQNERFKALQRRAQRNTLVNFVFESAMTLVQILAPPLGLAATLAQALEVNHMGYAAIRDLRAPRNYLLNGYMLGRNVQCERLLLNSVGAPESRTE